MTNKVTMPEPVAYPSDDWVETFFGLVDESGFYVFRGDFGNIADRFRIAAKCAGLITTDQAEAYADAKVRELAIAAQELADWAEHEVGACPELTPGVAEIRALIPPTE